MIATMKTTNDIDLPGNYDPLMSITYIYDERLGLVYANRQVVCSASRIDLNHKSWYKSTLPLVNIIFINNTCLEFLQPGIRKNDSDPIAKCQLSSQFITNFERKMEENKRLIFLFLRL